MSDHSLALTASPQRSPPLRLLVPPIAPLPAPPPQVGRKQGTTKPAASAACLPASSVAIGHSCPASVDSRHAPVETDAARIDFCLFSHWRWHVAAGPTRVPSEGAGRWRRPLSARPAPLPSCPNQRHNGGRRSERGWCVSMVTRRPAGGAGALQVIATRRHRLRPDCGAQSEPRPPRAETGHGSAPRVLLGFASFRKGGR